ncbi:hypothetical protein SZ64_04460 [Erythrobacter sp. SG61-1L]|uniref:terminase gpA endonuclease subunit n=1 Tax=Erythrobacter sp. SG61-1L TaxID=1603897 RepID=UPI0006C904E2|nr:terminase gpA endonuclease subunit [Erythrobacter sp. SG61-1L]KPL67421.1 hypothetical protein SZ64_04460 [Erythrobacter sp. SG61-1L]
MEALLSPASLQRQVKALAAGEFLKDPLDLLGEALELYQPPEQISTVDCAEKYRLLPGAEGGAVVRYDRWLTPYNVGPMHALDNPKCNVLVMPKPSRSGGTAIAENYLFKMIRLGPMGHVSWVLNSDEAVTDYCRNVVKPMFDLNPDLSARVGKERGENTDTFKRINGYPVEWLSAKDSTFRNRQPVFMEMDEPDAWAKKYAATPKTQMDGRQKLLGSRRKGAIMSHPDLGWASGVAACFEDSSRGIYVMRCAAKRCRKYAAAYATKFWDEIPEFKLTWNRNANLSNDARIDLAERSAHMLCPHCGAKLSDVQRRAMVDEALREGEKNGTFGWLHRGQTFDAVEGILGEMADTETHGFWVHGLLLKSVTVGKLAREYEAALIKFERTQDVSVLKEFLSKALGEIFEGAATTGGVSAKVLKDRVREAGYDRGTIPEGVRFVTAAVDTGGRYFDVMWLGWDLEARSWLIDRQTLRQRLHSDGIWRDINLAGNIDDWSVLLDMVVARRFPIEGRPDLALPVAVTCIDSGDGNVTWKAREFARRAMRKGYAWGGWSKVKLVKGFAGKRPILSDPRKVDKDENGKPVEPVTLEYNIGADRAKELTLERLAVRPGRDGAPKPGQCAFPRELEGFYIDQFFGETLIDGKWKRSGPNESLDLYGYNEAARLMLRPDNEKNIWTDEARLPVWARPVPLLPEGGDPKTTGGEVKAGGASAFALFDQALNQSEE